MHWLDFAETDKSTIGRWGVLEMEVLLILMHNFAHLTSSV